MAVDCTQFRIGCETLVPAIGGVINLPSLRLAPFRLVRGIIDLFGNSKIVIPAKAGIQRAGVFRWIPAYAGMTTRTQE